jgi:2-polyprenyl-6-methoxyphenol hydroxylase-like FAD-dependent oxidoreductase
MVIGGGVGGLTTALALHRAGIDVTVFERAPDVTRMHAGGGLTLWHNGMRGLEKLGLADEVERDSAVLHSMEWRTYRDAPLASWPIEDLNRKFEHPVVGIARAALHPVMLAAMPEGVLRAGMECTGYEQDGSGVTARFADGSEERGDLLIGADGVRSTVRVGTRGDEELRWPGYVVDVGHANFENARLQSGYLEIDGPGLRFISFPVAHGEFHWSCIRRLSEQEARATKPSKAEMLELFKGWPEPIEELIAATEDSAIGRRDVSDRKPVERWGKGRVTLLGDAAHPMTPNAGQGACQAIEDGIVLAQCLEGNGDVAASLSRYEERRVERANMFVKRAWMIGSLGRWKNPVAVRVRFAVQKRVVPNSAFKEQEEACAYEF